MENLITNKIISYSLFGNNPKYTQGMIVNAELAKKYMPEWEVWIWHDDSVSSEILEKLSLFDNVTLMFFDENYPVTAARFKSANYANYVVFKDADDRISHRWITTVNEWIDSGITNHVIKDHPEGHSALILAGMWGTSKKVLSNIDELLIDYYSKEREITKNSDQEFLAEVIYPIIKNDTLFHSEHYTIKIEGNSKMVSFTTKNNFPSNYIGVALLQNDYFAYENDAKLNGNKPYVYDFETTGDN